MFPDGKVCISILHPAGEDAMNPQESASERWSPVHTVRGVLLLLLLGSKEGVRHGDACCCCCCRAARSPWRAIGLGQAD